MDDEKYNRSVTLLCPTCGGEQFKYDDEDDQAPVICQRCQREMSRQALIEANAENIEVNKDEMIDEIRNDVRKQFKDIFKGGKWKVR